MTGIRAHLRAVMTLRSCRWTVLAAVTTMALLGGLARAAGAAPDAVLPGLIHAGLGPAALLGASWAGQDNAGQQWRTQMLARPRRLRLAAERLGVWCLLALPCAALMAGVAAAATGARAITMGPVLITAATMIATACATDAARSALGGAGLVLGVVWAAPVALQALPRVLGLLPARTVTGCAAGHCPHAPDAATAWLLAAVLAAGLTTWRRAPE